MKVGYLAAALLAVSSWMLSGCTESPLTPGVTPVPAVTGQAPGGEERVSPVPSADGETGQEGEEEDAGAASLEPEPERISVTVSAAGDVTLGSYTGQGYWGSFPETYDKEQDDGYFFRNVYDIFHEDDMTIVNLEGPLTLSELKREDKKFCISGDPRYVKVLTAGSVEAVSMGNNHRMDCYQQGVDDTVAALTEEGIAYAYNEYTGTCETADGILIGFVSVNEMRGGADVEQYIGQRIRSLQEQECDLILVCCHWGVEQNNIPEDYQRTLGRKCIDLGADLVIGHHPHVIQGIEKYQGKYIVYSLGNFCFGANRNPTDKDCLIIQQTFTFVDGVLQEDAPFRAIPCSVSSVADRNNYQPTPAQGAEAERILGRLNQFSGEFGLTFDEEGYAQTAEPFQ